MALERYQVEAPLNININMNKTLLERIAELEEKLAALKAAAEQKSWKADDIVPGLVVEAEGYSRCVVMPLGYNMHDNEPRLFWLGGLCDDPLDAFSNLHAATAQEVANYFNDTSQRKVGVLETNFRSLV